MHPLAIQAQTIQPLALEHTDLGSLAQLGFQRFAPHPFLQPWVQCYWTLNGQVDARTENLYPDGGTSLMLDFAAPDLPIRFNAKLSHDRMSLAGNLDRLGIRFHPGGAFQLLGLDISQLQGQELSLNQLGLARPLLQEQLAEAALRSARLQIIDNWLLQEARRFNAQLGLVQRLLPKLAQLSVEEISHQAAMSRRQLERKFQQQVGLSPIKLKQLLRVKQARQIISQHAEVSLTQIALDTGFYDQAHFIRQFQQVTGQTHGLYRQRKLSQKYNR